MVASFLSTGIVVAAKNSFQCRDGMQGCVRWANKPDSCIGSPTNGWAPQNDVAIACLVLAMELRMMLILGMKQGGRSMLAASKPPTRKSCGNFFLFIVGDSATLHLAVDRLAKRRIREREAVELTFMDELSVTQFHAVRISGKKSCSLTLPSCR